MAKARSKKKIEEWHTKAGFCPFWRIKTLKGVDEKHPTIAVKCLINKKERSIYGGKCVHVDAKQFDDCKLYIDKKRDDGIKQAIQTTQAIQELKLLKPSGSLSADLVIEPIGNFDYIYNKSGKKGIQRAIQDKEKNAWYIEIEGEKYYFKDRPLKKLLFKVPPRDDILAFCGGQYKVKSGQEIYNDVLGFFELLYELPEEKHYQMITLGCLQSWNIEAQNSTFYLAFGAKWGSGKTVLLEGMSLISRHGFLVGNVTEAIARDIDTQALSIFCDEIDSKTKSTDNPLYQCYRQGYRRGNKYVRHREKTFEIQSFDPFGFKGYSIHTDVEKALKTRTVMIPLKVSASTQLPILNIYKEQLAKPIHDDLFFWYMENGPSLYRLYSSFTLLSIKTNHNTNLSEVRNQLYNEITKGFSKRELVIIEGLLGRNVEIGYIALSVCKAFDIDISDSIESSLKTKQKAEGIYSEDYLVELLKDKLIEIYDEHHDDINYILTKGQYQGCFFYPKTVVYDRYREVFKEKGIRYVKSDTFTGFLRELNFEDDINVKFQRVRQGEDDKEGKSKKCLIFDASVLDALQISPPIKNVSLTSLNLIKDEKTTSFEHAENKSKMSFGEVNEISGEGEKGEEVDQDTLVKFLIDYFRQISGLERVNKPGIEFTAAVGRAHRILGVSKERAANTLENLVRDGIISISLPESKKS